MSSFGCGHSVGNKARLRPLARIRGGERRRGKGRWCSSGTTRIVIIVVLIYLSIPLIWKAKASKSTNRSEEGRGMMIDGIDFGFFISATKGLSYYFTVGERWMGGGMGKESGLGTTRRINTRKSTPTAILLPWCQHATVKSFVFGRSVLRWWEQQKENEKLQESIGFSGNKTNDYIFDRFDELQ